MAYSGDVMALLSDVNAQKSDDYFRGLGFDKGRQGASDYLAEQRQAQGGLTLEEKQRTQTEANMRAIQPAVTSLEAGIPELKQAYQTRQDQLTAEKDPLIQRYEQLLGEIRGREASQVNDTTRTTNREMGRRGITLDSTFAAEELQGRTAPIHSQAQSDILSTTFDREAKLREIDNSITNLTSEMVAAERDIRNSIAQIQATAGQQGVSQALQLYQMAQQERQAALDRLVQEKQIAATAAINQQNANTSAIKEVQGGLYNTSTGQWVVPPKATTGSSVLSLGSLGNTTTTQPVNGNQFLVNSGAPASNSKQNVQQNLGVSKSTGSSAPSLWQILTSGLGATPSYTDTSSNNFLSGYNIGGIKL